MTGPRMEIAGACSREPGLVRPALFHSSLGPFRIEKGGKRGGGRRGEGSCGSNADAAATPAGRTQSMRDYDDVLALEFDRGFKVLDGRGWSVLLVVARANLRVRSVLRLFINFRVTARLLSSILSTGMPTARGGDGQRAERGGER
eukprot:CAMPEP_0184501136 /NCGR_PEP_ID=MMETSP0113_2-20130426/46788_1 /TAXON_ID=91329 /ORGANISM="Norrisiella sphaerica, Strain BC52" /LENGTH=144 /DNA_ID=CAMNT_0026889785 /DNA_START=870 /DNA_END=1305 /DNA_ORIENTATION=-